MPNWTENTITITGRKQTLQRLHKLLKSSDSVFTFNNIRPCPAQLMKDDWQSDKEIARKNVEQYGYEGWYDWRVAIWGTKWEAANASFNNIDGGGIIYNFDTAWSPPTELIDEIARRFPSLEISHEVHEEAGLFPSYIKTYRAGGGVFSVEIENKNLISEDEEDQ